MKVPGLPSFEGAPPGPSEAVVRPQNDFEVLFSRYKYVNLASAQQLMLSSRTLLSCQVKPKFMRFRWEMIILLSLKVVQYLLTSFNA